MLRFPGLYPKLTFLRSPAGADLMVFGAGVLAPLAFAPLGIFPLAILAPAVLFALWLDAAPARAAWRGFLFGLGMFGVGVSWIYVAIHDFGHSGVALALFLTGLFVSILALYPALLGYLAARIFPGNGWPKYLLALPAGWVLFEWWRGWFLTGFPWLNLGYSQIGSPLGGYAPLVGVYGVSLAVAASAGLLLGVLRLRARARLACLVALAAVWGGGLLAAQWQWTQPSGAALRVSLVQGNIPQDTKWRPELLQPTLDLYAGLTRARWGDDLVIWPEGAVTAFHHQVTDSYLAPLARTARAHGTDLLIGLPVMDLQTRRYYNSMLSLGADEGFYHKRHLVPFGDYVPLAQWLRGLIAALDLPMSGFSPGPEDQPLLAVAGRAAAVAICYEDIFGEELIRSLPRAELLVNATNNAWYGDSFAPHQHLEMSRMRALETGRYMLRVTTNGVSAVIDARGRIVARSPQFRTFVLTGEARPMQGATPYVRLGNLPVLLVLAAMLGYGWFRLRRAG